MMNVSVTADWQGRPLSALNDLIGKRVARMGETCRDACIATAINVVNSLRKATRKAPQRANAKSFRLELTPYVGGWMKEGGRFHRVARVPGTGSRAPIYPVNHAGQRYVRGETIKVWRITPRHGERMKWEKNRNDGCWYVFAQSEAVARRLAVELMSRVLRKECGMA